MLSLLDLHYVYVHVGNHCKPYYLDVFICKTFGANVSVKIQHEFFVTVDLPYGRVVTIGMFTKLIERAFMTVMMIMKRCTVIHNMVRNLITREFMTVLKIKERRVV